MSEEDVDRSYAPSDDKLPHRHPRGMVIGRSVDSYDRPAESVEPESEEVETCAWCREPIEGVQRGVEMVDYSGAKLSSPQAVHEDQCAYFAREQGWGDPPVFIEDMARLLERDEHTVRRWVRDSEKVVSIVGDVPIDGGLLPRDLWPEREPEGRRRLWWRQDQVEGLRDFALMKAQRKGWRSQHA